MITNEQYIVNHLMMIANYSGVAISFFTFLWFKFRSPTGSIWKKLAAGYAAAYVPFVFIVRAFDRYITYRVYTFDHDGDRIFQDHEFVGDLAFFWDAMIADTARDMAPITGLFTCAISTALAYGLAVAYVRVARYCRN